MSLPSSPEAPRGARGWSIAWRLTVWQLILSSLILLLGMVISYEILASSVRHAQDQYISTKLRTIRNVLHENDRDLHDLKEEVEQDWAPRQYNQVYVRVLTSDGKILAESPNMRVPVESFPNGKDVPPSKVPESGTVLWSTDGRPMRGMAASAARGLNPGPNVTVQVAMDTSRSYQLMGSYRQALAGVFVGGLAVLAFIGNWLIRTSLRPLRRISATAQRVRSSHLDERIATDGLPTELSAVALRFNAMLDRLQDSFARLSRFSADIAHELRTPVNNLRIEIEVALGQPRTAEEYRETLSSCLEEHDRLRRLIDSLLFIARAEDPRTQIQREALDVCQELERVRDFYEAPANDAGIELVVTCTTPIEAPLDRTLFQRAISNLVGNSLRYTPRGGRIEISACRDNGDLKVDVADTGSGIDPRDLPNIFDRFYRADPSRSTGTGNLGLGLAIVNSIVALHGGGISVRSKPGSGTCMTLRIPMSPAAVPSPLVPEPVASS